MKVELLAVTVRALTAGYQDDWKLTNTSHSE